MITNAATTNDKVRTRFTAPTPLRFKEGNTPKSNARTLWPRRTPSALAYSLAVRLPDQSAPHAGSGKGVCDARVHGRSPLDEGRHPRTAPRGPPGGPRHPG